MSIEDDVKGVVERLVPQSIPNVYGKTGLRELGPMFNGYRMAMVGLLSSRPEAIYYVLLLSARRLEEEIDVGLSMVSSLSDSCLKVTRKLQPVSDISSLHNADVALNDLASSLEGRGGTYLDVEVVPAFKRFSDNVQRFLDEEGRKATYRGQLVQTPEEEKTGLSSQAMSLRQQYDRIVGLCLLWSTAVDVYESLQLDKKLTQDVLTRTQKVLKEDIKALEGMTPEERLVALRQVTLNALSARAVVRGFSSPVFMPTYAILGGEAYPFISAEFPGGAAGLRTISAVAIDPSPEATNDKYYELECLLSDPMDSAHCKYFPSPSAVAKHLFSQPVDITFSSPGVVTFTTENNNPLALDHSSLPKYLTASHSVSIPAAHYGVLELMDVFRQELLYSGMYATVFFTKTSFAGPAKASSAGLNSLFIAATGVGSQVSLGDQMRRVGQTTLATTAVWEVDQIVNNDKVRVVSRYATPNPPLSQTIMGMDGETYSVEFGAVADARLEVGLGFPSVTYGTRLTAQDTDGTLQKLGYVSGAVSRSLYTPISSIIEGAKSNPPQVTCTQREEEFLEDRPLYADTVPGDRGSLILYLARGQLTWTIPGPTPVSLQFNINDLGDVRAADTLLFLDGVNANLYATVASVVDEVATVALPPGFDTSQTSGEVLLGNCARDRFVNRADFYIELSSVSSINDGKYKVDTSRMMEHPLKMSISPSVPSSTDYGGVAYKAAARVFGTVALFQCSSNTRKSRLYSVLGSALLYPLNYPTRAAEDGDMSVARAIFFGDGRFDKSVDKGDIVEVLRTSSRNELYPIRKVSGGVAEFEDGYYLPADYVPEAYSVLPGTGSSAAYPAVRVIKGLRDNYKSLAVQLNAQATVLQEDTLSTFRTLDSGLNPLKANKSPTAAQANAPRMTLSMIQAALQDLKNSISLYSADVVEPVDVLIRSYKQKGLDRAVDVLLSADFETFFQMDMEDSSYSGYLQKTLRSVEINDYPVRRDNRVNAADAVDEQTIAQFDDVDFEYTPDQLDPQDVVSPPELNSPNTTLPV